MINSNSIILKSALFLIFLICFTSAYTQRSFYEINQRCTYDDDRSPENAYYDCYTVNINITRDYNKKAFFFFHDNEKIKIPFTSSQFEKGKGITYFWNRKAMIVIAFKPGTNIPRNIGVLRENGTLLNYSIESWRKE